MYDGRPLYVLNFSILNKCYNLILFGLMFDICVITSLIRVEPTVQHKKPAAVSLIGAVFTSYKPALHPF